MKLRAKTIFPTSLIAATADAGSSSRAVATADHRAASAPAGIERVNRFVNAMSRNSRPL